MPRPSKRLPARDRPELRVEELDPYSLRSYADNARTHSPRQIQQLAASMSCFGFVSPALINANAEIIAGHARVEAAKALGLKRIPCIRVEHLSKAQEKAYRLADNRLAESATWDYDLLAKELQVLSDMDLDWGRFSRSLWPPPWRSPGSPAAPAPGYCPSGLRPWPSGKGSWRPSSGRR
jgi:hypothetical protein